MTVIALPGVATSVAPQTPPAAPPVQTAPAGPSSDTPNRWSDPLRLIQNEAPAHIGRIVLWIVSLLTLTLFVWAAVGKLDIVATTEGKLVSQTLLKVVQPAEQGVIKQILVQEGDTVQAGQVLVRLDTTVAKADTSGLTQDMAAQRMQERRITSELTNKPFSPQVGDDLALFAQVQGQLSARRGAQIDALEQERQLLAKAQGEHLSARQILTKLQQSLPGYLKVAADYK